jgi:hypothetical protein
MTQAERAKRLGLSARMLRRHERAGCPRDLSGARAWLARHVVRRSPAVRQETARLRAAQADVAELLVAERRAELMPVAEVHRVLEASAAVYASADFPAGLAEELAACRDPALIAARLRDAVRELRLAVAAAFRRLAVDG